jgi:hypothetical protein
MSIQVLTANFVWALNPKHVEKKSRWIKAREGFVTVNVDATFDFERVRELQGL